MSELGLATTLAVLLQELPQELGDFGILTHCGLAPRRAALLNFASASTAMAGAVLALLTGCAAGERLPELLTPITAGAFVYIAVLDLLPELKKTRSPPLAVLGALVRGDAIPEADAVLALTERLREELPRMLEEHQAIARALDVLSAAAAAENRPEIAAVAHPLIQHARHEEEVLYPAALLVGDYLQLQRQSARSPAASERAGQSFA